MKSLHYLKVHHLLIVLFVMSFSNMPFETNGANSAKPDFAFPAQVEKTAEADLRAALKANDGHAAVNAVIRLSLSKTIVQPDKAPEILKQIAELAETQKDPAVKSLLNLLSATIYKQYYDADQWRYNQRETIASDTEDFTLWSRPQFLERIISLINLSLIDASTLQSTPITTYSDIIDLKDVNTIIYPTLYDFVVNQALDLLETFSNYGSMNVLNSQLLQTPTNRAYFPGEYSRPLGEMLGLYAGVIDFHQGGSLPLFQQELQSRLFVNSHLFNRYQMVEYSGKLLTKPVKVGAITAEELRLYEENKGDENAAIFLNAAAESFSSGDEGAKDIYRLLQEYLQQFPNSLYRNDIENCCLKLSQASASLSLPDCVTPETSIPVDVKSENGKRVTVELFELDQASAANADNYVRRSQLKQLISTDTVSFFKETVPFVASKQITLTFPKVGKYAVCITVDGEEETSCRVISCSNLSLSVTRSVGSTSAWVVNPKTGAPVEGASMLYKPWSRRSQETALPGQTDANGEQAVKVSEYGNLRAVKGDDRYAPQQSISENQSESTDSEPLKIEMFTSLGLYHPGDVVDFSLVAYKKGRKQRQLVPNASLMVVLHNANREKIDTLLVTTDAWGRAEGKFTLPTSGLTGTYGLMAGAAAHTMAGKLTMGYTTSSHCFEVSDYKLPTFEVATLAINPPASLSDGASIEGVATTFSGFPVADAAVKAKVTVRSGWWWMSSESDVFYNAEAVTDKEGKFRIEIPAAAISSCPAPKGVFICKMDVTSTDGETHPLTATFNMGKPYGIVANIPAEINLDKSFKATVVARDANGGEKPLELIYTITSNEKPIATGQISTGDITQIFRKLPIGQYNVKFAPVDESMADSSQESEIILYNSNGGECPVDQPLWMPEHQKIIADGNGSAKVVLGSNCNDAYVRLLITTISGKIDEKRWLSPKQGMQELTVKMPEGEDRVKLQFTCVKDFKRYSSEAEVESPAVQKAIKVEIETFRDKVTPGNEEKITLRIKPTGDTEAESAVMVDMSNKAIDLLAVNPLRLTTFNPNWEYITTNGWSFSNVRSYVIKSFRFKDGYNPSEPAFQLYGLAYGLGNERRSRKFLSTRAYASAAMNTEDYDEVMYDAVPMMMAGYSGGGVLSESASDDSLDAGDGETAEIAEPTDTNESYRPSEIPLAFFRPMLTTDEKGGLEISYTVPDANTTWIFRAMAYNREMLTATANAEIVASKPIMVSQNAPRFLRTADEVTLVASVMNNTDAARSVAVKSSILSAATNKVLAETDTVITLEAMTSAAVSIPVVAKIGETALIYRVKAVSDDFIDGEQSLLPILQSEQDVIESEMFYIAPDEAQFTLNLPAMENGDRAYLNFTENPAWQVVSALPGLRKGSINSSIEAAASLFSAAVAEGIMRDNPEIAKTLRRWIETGDSALISSLQKNDVLKAMLLSDTPWVSAALSDTERMQRLALIFDRRQTRQVISEAIDQLAKLNVDGGWAWTKSYPKVSMWATQIVMEELGDLNRLGWLPSDARLQKMISQACAYLDREAVNNFKKYPKADNWLYVSIRDAFPDVKPSTAASRVVEAEIQRALANWKDAQIALKGVYALMLHNHGYTATARQILESLRQYATSTPERGMWWQQLDAYYSLWSYDRIGCTSIILDAFHAVEPNCADVEKIRQWLILNKTNNDWGSAVMTTQTIASILTSGKSLKINPRGTAIHIGDTLVEPQSQEYATGQFTEQITSMLRQPERMTIDRQADYPSVGGVVMMRRLPMDSIQAVTCQEIAVEKSLSVFDGKQWQPSSEFKVGDRVRVELTLKVENDLSYVVIEDLRAAGLEPVEQLPTPLYAEGLMFYRENRDSQTNIFIDFLPRGTYRLAYELYASQAGRFSSGVAQLQSQYNPIVAAHSAGMALQIK